MKKISLIILIFISHLTITNANNYKCDSIWNNSDTKHNLYSEWDFIMTDSDDTYKCDNYWMQWNTLDSKWWNDSIYISKNTWNKQLTINMWDWNDNFYHTFHNIQLNWTTINGWNWNDTVNISWANVDEFEIVWDCKNNCKIKHKESSYLFKDVELISIENLTFNNILVTNTNNSSKYYSNNIVNNTNNSNIIFLQNKYPKIDLSSYKTIIPAYWWNYELNKKISTFKKKSAIIIINPSNWDFDNTEDIFVDEIKQTQKNNNLAIWYIYSKYWKRNLNTIKKSINNWLKYYPNIGWIFVDETSNSKYDYNFYKEIFNYIKSKNNNLVVVLNPWTNTDESYVNISDNIIIYENPCKEYNNHKVTDWIKKYNKDKFSFLWYKCNQSEYSNLLNEYKDYIKYFTDDWNDWNPWDSLSSFYKIAYNTTNSNIIDNNTKSQNINIWNNTNLSNKDNKSKIIKENNNKNLINPITEKLEQKINTFFSKLKKGKSKINYKKSLILLNSRIKKIKEKYKKNEIFILTFDYIKQKIMKEYNSNM